MLGYCPVDMLWQIVPRRRAESQLRWQIDVCTLGSWVHSVDVYETNPDCVILLI